MDNKRKREGATKFSILAIAYAGPFADREKKMMSSDDLTSDVVITTTHKKTRWSAEEDRKLVQLVENASAYEKRSGAGRRSFTRLNWSELSRQMKDRSAKQCRERYINSLKPDVKKGQWTAEEDANIIRMQSMFGNQWSKIASCG